MPKPIPGLAIEALRAAGCTDFPIRMGDLGLFGALVDADDCRRTGARASSATSGARAMLKRCWTGDGAAKLPATASAMATRLRDLPQGESKISALLDAQGDAPLAAAPAPR